MSYVPGTILARLAPQVAVEAFAFYHDWHLAQAEKLACIVHPRAIRRVRLAPNRHGYQLELLLDRELTGLAPGEDSVMLHAEVTYEVAVQYLDTIAQKLLDVNLAVPRLPTGEIYRGSLDLGRITSVQLESGVNSLMGGEWYRNATLSIVDPLVPHGNDTTGSLTLAVPNSAIGDFLEDLTRPRVPAPPTAAERAKLESLPPAVAAEVEAGRQLIKEGIAKTRARKVAPQPPPAAEELAPAPNPRKRKPAEKPVAADPVTRNNARRREIEAKERAERTTAKKK